MELTENNIEKRSLLQIRALATQTAMAQNVDFIFRFLLV